MSASLSPVASAARSLALLSSLAWAGPPAAAQDAAQLRREEALEDLLSGCRLVGRFTDDANPDAAPAPDSYTITEFTPVGDGRWSVTAEVRYGGKPVLPVELLVDVLWAGDTPMLQLTDLPVPGSGTFDARVLFYEGRYAGTWSGHGHGGHLFGYVRPLDEDAGGAEAPVPGDGGGDGRGADEGGGAPAPGAATDDGAAGRTGANWPSFRGPDARGVAEGWPTPAAWDLDSGENVRWVTPIPGLAHSSPVVWGDRLWITTAIREEGDEELRVGLYGDIGSVKDEGPQRFLVICLDKRDGSLIWERTAFEGVPTFERHPKSSYAASTPATDGEHVVAFFGSEGLHCFSADGDPLWSKDLGPLDAGFFMVPDARWGFASSPVIHGDLVIVLCDVQGDSFLAALSLADGEELWRTPREDVPTWGTPTVDVRDGRAQVIVNGFKHTGGYDLATGEELWTLAGGGDIPVPTPVVAGDLVYVTSAHGRLAPISAIAVDARGTLGLDAEAHDGVVWSHERRGNYMQTPLVHRGLLYMCSDQGILRCYDARTGEERYSERLAAGGGFGFTGSGVAADGKLYFTSENGDVFVVKAGAAFELLAVNPLGETCMSTPAISEGTLYFRTRSQVVAIGS